MPVFLEKVEFSVEDRSWGSKEQYDLKGIIKVGVGAELGNVLDNPVCVYQDMTFGVSKLPKDIQEKLIDIYKDIQKYLDQNNELTLK